MEVVNGTSTFVALFSIVIAVALWQLALRLGVVSGLKWGNAFRRAVVVPWLVLLVILTTFVLSAYAIDLAGTSEFVENFDLNTIPLVGWIVTFLSIPGAAEGSVSTIEVYKYSALRLTPTIFWTFPKLRGALDVVADVVFYLLPAWSPMSTAQITKSRLQRCIELARSEMGTDPIVLAYSQGSRVAVDLMNEMPNPPTRLVTVGCPVDVLHGWFLGLSVGDLKKHAPSLRWTNFYRNSDFIGGPVLASIVDNRLVKNNFVQSHYGYYVEPDVIRFLWEKTGSRGSALG